MGISIFTDKEQQPTMEEVFAAVGPKRPLWENLTRFIAENYRIEGDFTFYGKNYGWAIRFRKGGKALLSIYPGKESFTVQIVIGLTQAEKAFRLSLGKNVRKVLEDARKFPEGRWLFINVETEQDVDDVQQLLMAKARPVS